MLSCYHHLGRLWMFSLAGLPEAYSAGADSSASAFISLTKAVRCHSIQKWSRGFGDVDSASVCPRSLVMQSQRCHLRASRRAPRRWELTHGELFMDVSESFMIKCVECGRVCFHMLKFTPYPFFSADSSHFQLSNLACGASLVSFTVLIWWRWRKHTLHIQRGKATWQMHAYIL